MATLAELRKQAKGMGIAAAVIRGASSANELQEIISDHSDNGNGSKGKKAAKSATKKAVASKKGKTEAKASKKSSTKAESKKATKNSKKSASSKSAPAKSEKGTAKRRATASDEAAGRHMIGTIDYSDTEGWNPREGSNPDLIHRALKKCRGNRDKVFHYLVENLWDFVPKKKQDGTKRTKDEAETLLKFRIAQTDWRFAVQTGQHEASENRAEYGSGGTKEKAPAKAPAKRGRPAKSKVEDKPKRGRPAKNSKKADAPKRGRPKGSKNAPKAEAPKRGRGRPKGSKNKK